MMEDKEVIRLFLGRGFQLSKDALPVVAEDPELVLGGLETMTPRPFLVTTDLARKIIDRQEKPKIKLIAEHEPIEKPVTVDEYLKDIFTVFDKAKGILAKNPSLGRLISINKITQKTNEFSVIGMVKEKSKNGMVVEDATGEVQVSFDSDGKLKTGDVEVDDVVGVKCKRMDQRYYATQIVLPEIPLRMDVKRSRKESTLIFKHPDAELPEGMAKDTAIVYSIEEGANKTTLFNINGIRTLVLPKGVFKVAGKSDLLLGFLRKRVIHNTVVTPSGFLFMEEVPDIILSDLGPTSYKNHKGVTVISNSDYNKIFVINLKTREVEEKTA